MRSIYKPAAFVAAILLAFGVFAACNGSSGRACAAPMYSTVSVAPDGSATVNGAYYKGSSGGGFSGGSSGGGRSYSPPSNSGARSGSSSGSSGKSYSPPSNSGAKSGSSTGKYTAPVNSGARPSSTPVGGVPTKLSGNSYTYHGTNGYVHVYTYHPASYWVHLGAVDPYNPYDPRNFNNVLSPYYHTHIAC